MATAKRYPFDVPDRSYLFAAGRARPLADYRTRDPAGATVLDAAGRETAAGEWLDAAGLDAAALTAERTPVVACGSNAAPGRLAAKFADFDGAAVIPVLKARLADFAVVYSAHFAAYGSIPATLRRQPGGATDVFVAWPTAVQLTRLHQTEALGRNYDLMRLADGPAVTAFGDPVAGPLAYVGRHGALSRDGAAVAVAAFTPAGAGSRAADQVAALTLARDLLAPGAPLDGFISEGIADAGLRAARTRRLRALGLPPSTEGFAPA